MYLPTRSLSRRLIHCSEFSHALKVSLNLKNYLKNLNKLLESCSYQRKNSFICFVSGSYSSLGIRTPTAATTRSLSLDHKIRSLPARRADLSPRKISSSDSDDVRGSPDLKGKEVHKPRMDGKILC